MCDRLNHRQPPTASTGDQSDCMLHVLSNPLRNHVSSHLAHRASSPAETVRFLRRMRHPIGDSAPNVLMSCDRLSSQIDCCCLLNQYVCMCFVFLLRSLSDRFDFISQLIDRRHLKLVVVVVLRHAMFSLDTRLERTQRCN